MQVIIEVKFAYIYRLSKNVACYRQMRHFGERVLNRSSGYYYNFFSYWLYKYKANYIMSGSQVGYLMLLNKISMQKWNPFAMIIVY